MRSTQRSFQSDRDPKSGTLLASAALLFGLSGAALPSSSEDAPPDGLEPAALSAQERQQELQKLLAIAAERKAPIKAVDVEIPIAGRPWLGDADAPLVIVEFADFECRFCRRHALEVMPALIEEEVEPGRVQYHFHDYPVEQLHPFARKAAEASRCAADQGRYWDFRVRLYANNKALQEAFLPEHAEATGLDRGLFEDCLESGRHAPDVTADLKIARELRIHGTPAFFIGVPSDDGNSMRAFRRIDGAQDPALFSQALKAVENHSVSVSLK
jgi:protein-disulfide isomerase